MSSYNEARLTHSEAIERTTDDIIDAILNDNNVEVLNREEPGVSTETWLAVKAKILALLAEIAGE